MYGGYEKSMNIAFGINTVFIMINTYKQVLKNNKWINKGERYDLYFI